MSITIPEPWLMLLVFVVFLLTMILLNSWLFKPLVGFMDERDRAIEQDLTSVNASNEEIKKIDEDIKNTLDKARAEANAIIEQATIEAKATYESKIAKKQAESNKKIEDFRKELMAQQVGLEKELLVYLPEFEQALKQKMNQI